MGSRYELNKNLAQILSVIDYFIMKYVRGFFYEFK